MTSWKPPGWQISVLAERYLECLGADFGNLLLLLVQAPIIAFCIVLVWRDVDAATDSLYFVLALSAVWFGCINSCREIVKEGPVFARERMVGLNPTAYVLSKLFVLGLLSFIQALCLIFLVNHWVPLGGSPLLHLAMVYAASLTGTCLGLAISSVVATTDRAVAFVPILLLPQILFSKVVLSHDHASNLTKWCADMTITEWTYDGLKEVIAPEVHLGTLLQSFLALGAMSAVLLLIPIVLLQFRGQR
jgi:hypothetical protein